MHCGAVVYHGTVTNWRNSPADPRSRGGSGRIDVPISPKLGAQTYTMCMGDFIAAISIYFAEMGYQRQKKNPTTIWFSRCASLSLALVEHCSACEVGGKAATFPEGLKRAELLWKKVSHELFEST